MTRARIYPMTVDKLSIALSAANPQSIVWGVEGVLIDKSFVYLVDKEGNLLESGKKLIGEDDEL